MTLRAALYPILDEMPARTISGWQLFDIVEARTGRKPYPPNILRIVHDYADASGGEFVCIDKRRSVYQFEPGFKIDGAIADGRG